MQTQEMELASGNIPGQVGSYDQCVGMDQGDASRYCLLLSPDTRLVHRVVGLCVTNKNCSNADIVPMIVDRNRNLNSTFGSNGTYSHGAAEVYCSNYQTKLGSFGITALVIAIVLVFFVLFCTFIRYVKQTRSLGHWCGGRRTTRRGGNVAPQLSAFGGERLAAVNRRTQIATPRRRRRFRW